jgi:lipopolysaccharide transport system ATP-binding protein
MARILLENASFHYPVFEIGARSLKASLFRQMSGGKVNANAGMVEVQALNDINIDLRDGDRLGLIGRNGSGKSTLLRVLAGLAHPQKGRTMVQGRVVPLITAGIGINPELSGHANIELPLRLLGATTEEVRHARAWLPDYTGLGPFMHLPVRTYSEGMRARFSFALCTAIEADILILDEWLAVGDIDFQEKAQKRLLEMVDKTRIVIIATHSLALAEGVCTQVAWLDRGHQVMTGDPRHVCAAYAEAMLNPARLVVNGAAPIR